MPEQREPRHASRIRRLLAVAAVIAAIGGGSVGFAFFMQAKEHDALASRSARLLSLGEKRQIATELQAALAARSKLRLKDMTDHLNRAQALALPSGNTLLLGLMGGGHLIGCHMSEGEYNLYRALHVLGEMPTAPSAPSS